MKWIIPNAQKNIMEPILLTLDPGGSTYPDNPHEGEEFGYVISSNITLHIGIDLIRQKSESFYFTANKQHYITASEKHGATLLWVSTPPVFNILNNKGENTNDG